MGEDGQFGLPGFAGAGDPLPQGAVDAALGFAEIFREPVVEDGVADVGAAADIAGAGAAVIAAIAGAILGNEHLVVQHAGVQSVPTGIGEGLAADGKFDSVQFGVEVGVNESVGAELVAPLHAVGGEVFAEGGGVVVAVHVHIHGALAGLVARDDDFPFHLRDGVDIVGERGLAAARAVDINHDVDVERSLFGEGLQIIHIDAEIKLPVGVAAIAGVEGGEVARTVESIEVLDLAPADVGVAVAVVEAGAFVGVVFEHVVEGPIAEFLVILLAAEGAEKFAGADGDGAGRGRIAVVLLPGVGAVLVFTQIVVGIGDAPEDDEVVVGVAGCAVVGATDD